MMEVIVRKLDQFTASNVVRVAPVCGRLRVGKDFLTYAELVGAPMCSACGSHDRWP